MASPASSPASTSWLSWIFSPYAGPIQPAVAHPKLGLPNLVIPKKNTLIPAGTTKNHCLDPLPMIFESRTAVLNSLISALHNNNAASLNANKSEISNAMKQVKELGDLCNYCLEEYRWAPSPAAGLVARTEEDHKQFVAKSGELDYLEGEIIASLVTQGLYNRPAAPAAAAPSKSTVEKVQALFKHRFLTLGLLGSCALAIADRSWISILSTAFGGAGVAAIADAATATPEFHKNLKEAATAVIESAPSVAFPLACTVSATAKLNGCEGAWIPPFLGVAGIVSVATQTSFSEMIAFLPSLGSNHHYAYWRAGPLTGILPATVSGGMGYLLGMSGKASTTLAAFIWATHCAANYSIYQYERHR